MLSPSLLGRPAVLCGALLTLIASACGDDTTRDRENDAGIRGEEKEDASRGESADWKPDGGQSLIDWLNGLGVQTYPTTQEDLDRINAARGYPDDVPTPRPLPDVCSHPNSPGDTFPMYLTTLSSLCDLLVEYGRSCPSNRDEALTSVGDRCAEDRYRPDLIRGCGFDRITDKFSGGWEATWIFDTTTGALKDASVTLEAGHGCGQGTYLTTYDTFCSNEPVSQCKLCLGGSERNVGCPDDVLAILPSSDCVPPATGAPGCGMCGSPGQGFQDDTVNGSLCTSPTACEPCQDFGFISTCTCYRDGKSRWISVGTD